MEPHHQVNYTDVFLTDCFNKRNFNNDDGDYTETCWNILNVNFNTHFRAFISCIGW